MRKTKPADLSKGFVILRMDEIPMGEGKKPKYKIAYECTLPSYEEAKAYAFPRGMMIRYWLVKDGPTAA